MSTYEINGPTTIGTTGQLNNILGDLRFTDIGIAQGTVYYAAASGNIAALGPSTSGFFLQTQGAAADPVWASGAGIPAARDGFSVAKTAGDTFSTTAVVIGNWNTTTPAGVTLNPFFNVGAAFNTTTGIFTPTITGVYDVDLYIEFMNTNNSGFKTLTFSEQTVGPVENPIVTIGPKQSMGSTMSKNFLAIHQNLALQAGLTYCATIVSDNATGVNTIDANSRFNAQLVSS